MELAARIAFPNARIVTDRFHVQKLVSEALQEMRVKLRWEAIEEENELVKKAKEKGKQYHPKTYSNGDTVLNYFINRSTNASAESFNAKLKGFCALVRGVRDKKFFLFRVAKIYG